VTPESSLPPGSDHDPARDEVRERLVDAAATVFARDGFSGARIQDIVREAGLTTGAVYGRFRGKAELMHEAVVARATPQVRLSADGIAKVADLIELGASRTEPGLTEREALLLETFVAARRDPEVAEAVADADARWRDAVDPLVDAALVDGTVDPDVDPDAVLYLVRVLRMGLLLQRGSGLPGPDPHAWRQLMARVVASFGATDQPSDTDHSPHHTTSLHHTDKGTIA
jgi:AcrR family transcriptional regulator